MQMHDVITTVVGRRITAQDVIEHLKFDGTFRKAIYRIIEAHIIALECEELKVSISEEEFSEYADTKRRLMGLFSAEDMNRYCRSHGVVMKQWNKLVHDELLRNKLKREIILDEDTEAFFEEHKNDFLMVSLSRIVCAERQRADDAMQMINDGDEDFAAVARKLSIEKNTRAAGGYLGSIKVGTLPKTINDAVFSTAPGCVLGPFEQSGYWTLYRVEELKKRPIGRCTKEEHLRSLVFKVAQ